MSHCKFFTSRVYVHSEHNSNTSEDNDVSIINDTSDMKGGEDDMKGGDDDKEVSTSSVQDVGNTNVPHSGKPLACTLSKFTDVYKHVH